MSELRPDFNELMDNAEAGLARRAIARYLIPRDADASVKRHERFGTPIVRKIVMGTIGRIPSPYRGGGITDSAYDLAV